MSSRWITLWPHSSLLERKQGDTPEVVNQLKYPLILTTRLITRIIRTLIWSSWSRRYQLRPVLTRWGRIQNSHCQSKDTAFYGPKDRVFQNLAKTWKRLRNRGVSRAGKVYSQTRWRYWTNNLPLTLTKAHRSTFTVIRERPKQLVKSLFCHQPRIH